MAPGGRGPRALVAHLRDRLAPRVDDLRAVVDALGGSHGPRGGARQRRPGARCGSRADRGAVLLLCARQRTAPAAEPHRHGRAGARRRRAPAAAAARSTAGRGLDGRLRRPVPGDPLSGARRLARLRRRAPADGLAGSAAGPATGRGSSATSSAAPPPRASSPGSCTASRASRAITCARSSAPGSSRANATAATSACTGPHAAPSWSSSTGSTDGPPARRSRPSRPPRAGRARLLARLRPAPAPRGPLRRRLHGHVRPRLGGADGRDHRERAARGGDAADGRDRDLRARLQQVRGACAVGAAGGEPERGHGRRARSQPPPPRAARPARLRRRAARGARAVGRPDAPA